MTPWPREKREAWLFLRSLTHRWEPPRKQRAVGALVRTVSPGRAPSRVESVYSSLDEAVDALYRARERPVKRERPIEPAAPRPSKYTGVSEGVVSWRDMAEALDLDWHGLPRDLLPGDENIAIYAPSPRAQARHF